MMADALSKLKRVGGLGDAGPSLEMDEHHPERWSIGQAAITIASQGGKELNQQRALALALFECAPDGPQCLRWLIRNAAACSPACTPPCGSRLDAPPLCCEPPWASGVGEGSEAGEETQTEPPPAAMRFRPPAS